jgi:hypothetical protein
MVKKKDLVIVALATFCLTATLFMIVSTRSQPENRYNPWMDLDDNGQINILDAIDLSNVYGTSGDPTKNVTVTNLPFDENGNLKVNASINPKTIHKGVERIILLESFSQGAAIPIDNISWSRIYNGYFDWNPKGTLMNVTDVWIRPILGNKQTDQSAVRFKVYIDGNLWELPYWYLVGGTRYDPMEHPMFQIYSDDSYGGSWICTSLKQSVGAHSVDFQAFNNIEGFDVIYLYRFEIDIVYYYLA